jgi:hypothetical protein
LLDVVLEDSFEVGRASPGFASRELVYHPLPGKLATRLPLCFERAPERAQPRQGA